MLAGTEIPSRKNSAEANGPGSTDSKNDASSASKTTSAAPDSDATRAAGPAHDPTPPSSEKLHKDADYDVIVVGAWVRNMLYSARGFCMVF